MHEQSNTKPTPAENLGLTDGEFAVLRSDGSIDIGGWTATGTSVGPMGEREGVVHLEKIDEDGSILAKDVYADELVRLQETIANQTESDAARVTSEERASRHVQKAPDAGRLAVRGIISEVPLTAEQARAMRAATDAVNQARIDQRRAKQEAAVEQAMEDLVDPFNIDVRQNLRLYAEARVRKTEAQVSGSGDESIAAGQDMGRLYQELPESARIIADRYADLGVRLDSIHDAQ